jgi:hypothetical protein
LINEHIEITKQYFENLVLEVRLKLSGAMVFSFFFSIFIVMVAISSLGVNAAICHLKQNYDHPGNAHGLPALWRMG